MKKKTWIALCCLCVGILCGGIGIYKYFQEKQAGSEYEKLKEEVTKKEPQREERTEGNATEEVPSAGVNVPIDFATLQQQNPDVYAWITVGQTAVDYPILQHSTDNSYYLNHTIDGEEKPEGAIYTENYNTKTFEDPNTVIYGHDMKNGTMFAQLLKYKEQDFFEKYPYFSIYTPDGKESKYQIFVAGVVEDTAVNYQFAFQSDEEFLNYIETVKGTSLYTPNVEIDAASQIVTLSTCTNVADEERFVVQAVKVSEQ